MAVQSRPRGREDVSEALINAATRLFAERGPSAVGVREIAQLAGVNHGLVHRHFGSKTGLLKAVVSRLADEIALGVGEGDQTERLDTLLAGVLGATSRQGAWLRVLAWSILDGVEIEELQTRFPLARRMVEAARREEGSALSAEARVTLIMSVGLGMLLFGPFLKAATGQDEAQWERSRRQIMAMALRPSKG